MNDVAQEGYFVADPLTRHERLMAAEPTARRPDLWSALPMTMPQPRRATTQPVLLVEQSERQSRAAIERLDRIMSPVPPRLHSEFAFRSPLNQPGQRPEVEEVITELA